MADTLHHEMRWNVEKTDHYRAGWSGIGGGGEYVPQQVSG